MYQVFNALTHELVGEHKTKKAATEQADEMTKAHAAIDAKHDGKPLAFEVIKQVETLTASESAA